MNVYDTSVVRRVLSLAILLTTLTAVDTVRGQGYEIDTFTDRFEGFETIGFPGFVPSAGELVIDPIDGTLYGLLDATVGNTRRPVPV